MRIFKLLKLTVIFIGLSILINPLQAQAQQDYINIDKIVKQLKISSKGKLPFGFKLGTLKEKIEEEITQWDVYINEKDYIIYTVYFNQDKMDFGDVTYDFENDNLSSVSLETYFTNEKTCIKVMDLVKEALNKKYGKPRLNGDNYVWTYNGTARKLGFEVELADVSSSSDHGFQVDYYTEGVIP